MVIHVHQRVVLQKDGTFCRVIDRSCGEDGSIRYLLRINGGKKQLWADANDVRVRENLQPYKKAKLAIIRHIVIKIKECLGGCVVCGEDDPCCVDFHHLGDKTKDVSKLVKSRQFPKIIEEINKCICLCSNCHKKHHNGQLEVPVDKRIDLDEEILNWVFDTWMEEAKLLIDDGLGHEVVASLMMQKDFDPLARVRKFEVA